MVMILSAFWFFSVTYFLPFWFAFGVTASLVLNTHASVSRKSEARVSGPSLALPAYLTVLQVSTTSDHSLRVS